MSWWSEMQSQEDYYFIYGDDMDDVISGYRTLTGKAPIMPKWVTGYWQSREKYNTQDEVLDAGRVPPPRHTHRQHRHRLAALAAGRMGLARV